MDARPNNAKEINMVEEKKSGNKPAYIAYQVRDNEEKGEAFWTRIGVAFAHADQKGFNLILDSIPLTGQIALRVPKE
jgi:hypothetical protein